ncbi:MAG: hypothetical protein RL398_2841 [Planctomycetota bacterium]
MISHATMAPSGREIEYKLRAKAPIEIARVDALLRETGLPVRSRGSVVHVDVYLDTRDHALRRRGFGLRMRRADDAPCAVLTCKDRGRRDGARFDRREIEAPWLGAAPPPTVTDLPPEMRRILPAGEVGALVEVLCLVVRRERRVLVDRNGPLAEVVVDSVTAQRDGASATFEEVELEAHRDESALRALVERLRQDLDLAPAGEDKPNWALGLLDALRPRPAHDGDAQAHSTEGSSADRDRAWDEARQAALRFAADHLADLPTALQDAGRTWLDTQTEPAAKESIGDADSSAAAGAPATAIRNLRAALWRVVRSASPATLAAALAAGRALSAVLQTDAAAATAVALGTKRLRRIERLTQRLARELSYHHTRQGLVALLEEPTTASPQQAAALGAWLALAERIRPRTKKTLRRCRRLARRRAWSAALPS